MSAEQQRHLLDRVQQRLDVGLWEERGLAERLDYSALEALAPAALAPTEGAAAEVASFALGLAGKRRLARRARTDGRLRRMVLHFALAAMLALTAVTSAACQSSDDASDDSATEQVDVSQLGAVAGAEAVVLRAARAEPARYEGLVLLDPGSDTSRWAVLLPTESLGSPADPSAAPVLVDREGAGLDQVGGVYSLAARAVAVDSRDGPTQFLDPLAPAQLQSTARDAPGTATVRDALLGRWQRDERYAAAARAVAGAPTVLDALYNGRAAATAGGTHTYANGVVLRLDPKNPVLEVTDRALLESGAPLRAEDVLFVAIRASDRSQFDPGKVVTLRSVVMERYNLGQGSSDEVFIANAALEGARVEPTGSLDLQSQLNRRLQRTDADLAIQAQELAGTEGADPLAAGSPGAAATPTPAPTAVVRERTVYRGPSFVDDYLMWMWLTRPGYYGGSTVILSNPPTSVSRPQGDYYYTPPTTSSGAGAAAGAGQPASRSQALQAARNAVSGQASGTGGGTAATAKSASVTSERVSAATAKAGALAGQSSSASVGKSITSAAPAAAVGSTAARSAGSVASASRGTGSVGAASGKGASSGGFSSGGKGIGGGSTSS